jgi:hypothetical protein
LIIEPNPDNLGCATVRVDAAVDGRTYRLVLDSGAARTGMRSDAWIDALPSNARHESSGVFAATSEDLIVLPSITLGPLIITDVQATRAAVGESLLAMDVLGAAAIRIDLDRAELTIEASGTASLPWTLERSPHGHPFVDLRWPDATGRAIFDTGAGITVVDTSFARAPESVHPRRTDHGHRLVRHRGNGRPVRDGRRDDRRPQLRADPRGRRRPAPGHRADGCLPRVPDDPAGGLGFRLSGQPLGLDGATRTEGLTPPIARAAPWVLASR